MAMNSDSAHPRTDLVQRNEDGTLTKETVKRAMKAFRKRLKITRLDDESKLRGDSLTKGHRSGISAVVPPEQYPRQVWDDLAAMGRLVKLEQGLYEMPETPGS